MGEAALSYDFYNDPFVSLFMPDVVLPSQFQDIGRRGLRGGERKLMAAMLSDGIDAYLEYCTSDKTDELSADVCEWVHKRDSTYIFSFDVVCESLGIDPEYCRLGLARYLAAYNNKRAGIVCENAWKRIRRPRRK